MSRRQANRPQGSHAAAAILLLLSLLLGFAFPDAAQAAEKPKVRAITAFVRLDRAKYQDQIREVLAMLRKAKGAFERAGYEVQDIRITTQPFPEYTRGMSQEEALAFFRQYDELAQKEGFARRSAPPWWRRATTRGMPICSARFCEARKA